MNFFIKNMKYLTTKQVNQNQLSKKLGITRQSINSLLKTENPRADTLIKLSEIYKITIDDLLLKDLENEKR